jgi:hypothetical protein
MVRGYINLLEKMGIIEQVNKGNWKKVRITKHGENFAQTMSFNKKTAFFNIAVERSRWPHKHGIRPRKIAREIEQRLGRKQKEIEWALFGSHTGISHYPYSSVDEIVNIIDKFDSLPKHDREDIKNRTYARIKVYDDNPGKSSLENWLINVEYNYKYIVIDSDMSEIDAELLKGYDDDISDLCPLKFKEKEKK